jgi:hypothetical protein
MKNIMPMLREKVSTGSLKTLTAPYLPNGLIWAALLIAYTDCILILIGQPVGYWIDRNRAASLFPFLENILSAGILTYLLVMLTYLALFWLALTIFTRSLALVLWFPVSFVHLNHILTWFLEISPFNTENMATTVISNVIGAISTVILAVILVMILLPKSFADAFPSRVKRWVTAVVLWGWILGLPVSVAISAIFPRGGWMEIHPKHTPGRRAISAVAYDSARHRLVLFGGISDWIGSSFYYERDTWEWDGNDWIQMKPQTSPPARAGHMMAYDEKRGVVVMFGGEDKSGSYMFNDTWIWDGKNWSQMSPTGYPMGRRGGQMFYDPETERIVLTGGFYYATGKVFTAVNDTWAWNGKDWEYLTTLPENLMITNPNVAFSPSLKRPTLFDYKRLMGWNNNQWQLMDVGSMPVSRFGTWLAADPGSGKMMIFGGVDNNVQRNDTWLFDGSAWKEMHPSLTPGPRDAHIMFYDPNRDSFIIYGGISTYALDDMWEYVLP